MYALLIQQADHNTSHITMYQLLVLHNEEEACREYDIIARNNNPKHMRGDTGNGVELLGINEIIIRE